VAAIQLTMCNHNYFCLVKFSSNLIITFCVSRRRHKMYCGHVRLCVCLSAAVRPHYCTDPDVTWGHGRGCPLVVHYWADLQSGHGLRCYGNITRTLVTSLRPTLLRLSGLRASTGGVLATKSERKMLASTCLYSLYAWFIPAGATSSNSENT